MHEQERLWSAMEALGRVPDEGLEPIPCDEITDEMRTRFDVEERKRRDKVAEVGRRIADMKQRIRAAAMIIETVDICYGTVPFDGDVFLNIVRTAVEILEGKTAVTYPTIASAVGIQCEGGLH